MMLSDTTITELCLSKDPLISPFVATKQYKNGMSYGLSCAGYDIRVKQKVVLHPEFLRIVDSVSFVLVSSIEHFCLPNDIVGVVHDKSSWARRGLAVQNTILEPGWSGFLTLELSLHGDKVLVIEEGSPIAQVVFHRLDKPSCHPYSGKYSNQPDWPVEALYEEDKQN